MLAPADMNRFYLGFSFLPALAALAGCAGEGGLEQSRINPACAPTDLSCVVAGFSAPLAEGATVPVDVQLDLQGSAAPTLELVSGNPEVFEVEGQRLRGARAGVAALLVMAPGELVLDFLHIWVAQPSALLLHRRSEGGAETGPLPGKVQLLQGDELTVSVEPYARSQRLMGELESTWATDPAVVEVLENGAFNQRRLVARAPGATTLQVSALTLDTSLELEVLP